MGAFIKLRGSASHGSDHLFRGETASCWKFWEDGVSSSILYQFLQCREQTRLKLIEGWQSSVDPVYFAFGKACHFILATVYDQFRSPPSLLDIEAIVKRYEREWKRQEPIQSSSLLEQREEVLGLATKITHAYFQRWAGDFPGKKYPVKHTTWVPKNWVKLETQFNIPYTYPDGREVPIVGTRDSYFLNERKREVVLDTKCYKVINPEDLAAGMPADMQLMTYMWSLSAEIGRIPAGCIKNVIRRPSHRRGPNESISKFCRRIHEQCMDKKNYDHWFQRYQLEITSGEINEWIHTVLDPIMLDIRWWWEGKVPHYMNPTALINKYGRVDMFDAIVNHDFRRLRRTKDVMAYQTRIA